MQEKKPAEEVPIRYLKGVGPKKAEVLERLGIFTARDLLFFLPRRYEDRSEIVSVKDLRPGDVKAVVGKVMSSRTFRAGTGTVITEAAVGEGTSRVFAVWYNQPYIKKFFTEGAHVMLYGRVDLQKRLQIVHPAFEVFEEGGVRNTLDIGRIV
ncbi:MAG: DNA helicase RecG, partial [Candidatus Omnitrophica bacterium]|nr:DNA helicase RecG [Candidatus Omnitrophota bacterium]